jgi:hypothetical protein
MPTLESNKAVAARWLDTIFNHPENLEKSPTLISARNPVPFDRLVKSWSYLHARYHNIRADIMEQVAEADKVFTRLKVRGEEVGQDGSVGETRTWEAFFVHTVHDGAIAGGGCGSTMGSI